MKDACQKLAKSDQDTGKTEKNCRTVRQVIAFMNFFDSKIAWNYGQTKKIVLECFQVIEEIVFHNIQL